MVRITLSIAQLCRLPIRGHVEVLILRQSRVVTVRAWARQFLDHRRGVPAMYAPDSTGRRVPVGTGRESLDLVLVSI